MLKRLKRETLANARGRWLIFSRDKLLVPDAEALAYADMHWEQLPFLHHYSDQVHRLPPLGHGPEDIPVYIIDMGAEQVNADNWSAVSLRQVMMIAGEEAFSVLGRAWQYVHFLRTHRFCGQCGGHTTRVEWEMAVQCDQCQHRSYPRISPCIIVAIYRNDEILLARGVRHRETNMYSTLAGFVESGESLEQAVHREVFEEVGVKVKNLRYFSSQPWPFPHSLMVGFIAQYSEGEIVCQESEIDDAQWFNINALPKVPPKFSIAGQLIHQVVNANHK
tara:strand:- start:173 stop:1003 length:831 start_codon:yes stop_codon:yes gene_type:complete